VRRGRQPELTQCHDTGRALMVVGTMKEAKALAKKLGMADLKWMQERAEFAEWPRSPQLELAIVASAARDSGPLAGREWAIANTTRDLKWRFDVPRRKGLRGPSHENHRCPPKEPAARPSVAPQQGADGSPSRGNARLHPLRQTSPLMRPSPSSQEELRNLIQTEVALMLGPYRLLLEKAKAAAEQQSRAAEE
jgi:hypothetical protein